jgi:hypothetical protein
MRLKGVEILADALQELGLLRWRRHRHPNERSRQANIGYDACVFPMEV